MKTKLSEKEEQAKKTLIKPSKNLTLLQRAAKWLNLAIFPQKFPDLTGETM